MSTYKFIYILTKEEITNLGTCVDAISLGSG